MDWPSTSEEELSFERFLALPWHILRKIITNLDPLEMARFAHAHPQFKALIADHPKRFRSIHMSQSEIEVCYGKRHFHYAVDFRYSENADHRAHLRRQKERPYFRIEFNKEGWNEDEWFKILMTNTLLNRVSEVSTEMLDWNFECSEFTEVSFKDFAHIDRLLTKFKPRLLEFTSHNFVDEDEDLDEELFIQFITSPRLECLEALKIDCLPSHLGHFLPLSIPILAIQLGSTIDFSSYLSSFVEEMIREWEAGEREINLLVVSVPMDSDHGDDEEENALNIEINDMAHALSITRNGYFKDKRIDPRFKLIHRDDGTGLFIMTGVLCVILMKCDYTIRRIRGLGSSMAYQEILNEAVESAQDVRGFLLEMKKLKAKEKMKNPPIIEQCIFSIFNVEPFEDDGIDLDKAKEEEDLRMELARLESLRNEEELNLVKTLKSLAEYRKGVPERELAIDCLWLEKEAKVSMSAITCLKDGVEALDRFPITGWYSSYERCALEVLDEYLRIGTLPNMLDYPAIDSIK